MRFHHKIKTLCRVLNVNRSTYYKHFSGTISNRTLENQKIRSYILSIYSASKKRLGVYKICYLLGVEYGINISVGRVYRIMKSINLPKMSTIKPKFIHSKSDNSATFKNKINKNFFTDKPNLVWVSDITYVKVNGSFNYICVIIDLYSRKVISYSVSNKMDVKLPIHLIKLLLPEIILIILYFILTEAANTPLKYLESYWIVIMLYNLFLLKVILMTMPLLSLSSNF